VTPPAPSCAPSSTNSHGWRPRSPAACKAMEDDPLAYTALPSLPSAIAQRTVQLAPATLATVEHAAIALARADTHGGPATDALLRSESAASSKIEHIEANQRYIARALAGLPTRQRAARRLLPTWMLSKRRSTLRTARSRRPPSMTSIGGCSQRRTGPAGSAANRIGSAGPTTARATPATSRPTRTGSHH
jgi:hypothetical protein